ncbi:MAG: DUF1566 domain-containing protein [Rhodoferax sp.]|nr:DUF1566 domain-containing protein [Rhodoferax sp.]
MNFPDDTLPEISKNYLDLLALLSVKLSEQNQFMEKSQLNNTALIHQLAALSANLAEQAAVRKNEQTQMATLIQRAAVLEGDLASLTKAYTDTKLAVKQMATAAAGVPDVNKDQPAKKESLMADRYLDNLDGTVTDVTTGLQWMRFSLGQTWQDGNCAGKAKEYEWDDAKAVVDKLNRETGYAGCHDWRLPSKEELLGLVYCTSGKPKTWNDSGEMCAGHYEKPTIFQPAFPNTESSDFWSDSPNTSNSSYAWLVSFYVGDAGNSVRYHKLLVRLVRGGQ